MAESIKLSEEASNNISKIIRILRMDRPTVVRLALAKGFLEGCPAEPTDSKGIEMPVSAINGKDEIILNALTRHLENKYIDDTQIKKVYKNCIEVGSKIITKELEKNNEDLNYLLTIFPK